MAPGNQRASPPKKRYHALQANLQRNQAATAELVMKAGERKAAFALVQEPYIGNTGEAKRYSGVRLYQCARTGELVNKSAIMVFDDTIDVTPCPTATTENIVAIKLRTGTWEMGVISIYLECDKPLEPYLQQIKKARKDLGTKNLILGGDVNAWSAWWGSKREDDRGANVSGFLDEQELHVLNRGIVPTFEVYRGGKLYTSNVDITACSTSVLGKVENWRVSREITSSDHNAILFDVELAKGVGTDIKSTTRLYNTKKANWAQFRAKLSQSWIKNDLTKTKVDKIDNISDLEDSIKEFTNRITETCKDTIPARKNVSRIELPWWNKEISSMNKSLMTLKRRISCAAPIRREHVVKKYLEQKERYQNEVKQAQTQSWKRFCERQNRESMWDGVYRVIRRTTKREEEIPLISDGAALVGKGSAKLLAETFFPEDDKKNDNVDHTRIREKARRVNEKTPGEPSDPPFTMEELMWSVKNFNPKKAPGLDGFTADICTSAISLDPQLFLSLVNKCLHLEYFPSLWKEAVVVALRKPGKDSYTHPKSYRPIGLLPVLGKILEKMLIKRLRWYILPGASQNQYGFTPQRSTEDSLYTLMQTIQDRLKKKQLIALVSLDIEGAFDNAWWPAIVCELAGTKCPPNLRRMVDSYLTCRRVRVRYAGAEYQSETTKGCVQGSIGGPLFWNLLLDPLLKELEEGGHYCQAFADDVVLVFSGDTAVEIQQKANKALANVRSWGVKNKLNFAPQKTKAMVITRKLKFDSPNLSMGGIGIELSQEIKILGLTIDNKLTFNTHVSNICRKATGIYKQLERAARIHWGLNTEIVRTIYTAVIEPTVLYAAAAWASASRKQMVRKQLNAVQLGFTRKMIKAYRTVSLNSALLLAGLLPLDIRVREAASLYEIKKGYSQRVVGDRGIETPLAQTRLDHPAQQVDLRYRTLVDGAELAKHINIGTDIYTDGSKIEGKVGAALSVWENGVEIRTLKLKLEPFCSVYQAELLAICKATELAKKSTKTRFHVYSDSRSALDTLVSGYSLHTLVLETHKNIREARKQKTIELFWIKAHAGLEGNERADMLAKAAALGTKIRPHYDRCPLSFVRRQIRMDSLDEWDHRYKEENTGSVTKVFFPEAIKSYKIVRKMQNNHIVTQILTGHGGFSEYLHRFGCKESPSCRCEDGKHESILHALTECPIFGRKRYDLEQEIDQNVTEDNIASIMISNKYREKFLNYAIIICKSLIEKNK